VDAIAKKDVDKKVTSSMINWKKVFIMGIAGGAGF
jgi:hypothetical protein